MPNSFVEECDEFVGDAWLAYRNHPWIEAMAAGTLPVEKFVRFQVDDAPYISDLHRALALGVSKAPTGSSWAKAACTVLDDVWVLGEIEAKQELLAELGRTAPLPRGPEAYCPAREAYANHLVRTALECPIGEIAAALLPCAMFTEVIGRRFRDVDIPGPDAYRRWARIYVERAVHRMAAEHAAMMEAEAARTDDRGRARMKLKYLRSVQHQIAVFDSAWELDIDWPGSRARTAVLHG
ncbi:thiaminase II [Saccharopolyspora rosea]|uniref:TenA family protein n=1 Tax=Saccharopolyspora rosea TaxID=524884 RepID=A0ABW3FZU7_9PSEU